MEISKGKRLLLLRQLKAKHKRFYQTGQELVWLLRIQVEEK
jgi:hypothetical protein